MATRKPNLVVPSLWGIGLVVADFLIYGWVLPIFGVYFGGSVAVAWGLNPFQEIILIILSVFALLFFTFYAHLETTFWTHLFSRDEGFLYILQLRDLLNLFMMVYSFRSVFYTVSDMIADKEMKKEYLSEGLGYIVLKPVVDLGLISESWLDSCQCRVNLMPLSMGEDLSTKITEFLFQWFAYLGILSDNESPVSVDCVKDKFVHGAQFVLAIAGLTATITKVVYFNTLYAYVRAMNIFISMQSEEDHKDDEEDTNEEEYEDGIMDSDFQHETEQKEKFIQEKLRSLHFE